VLANDLRQERPSFVIGFDSENSCHGTFFLSKSPSAARTDPSDLTVHIAVTGRVVRGCAVTTARKVPGFRVWLPVSSRRDACLFCRDYRVEMIESLLLAGFLSLTGCLLAAPEQVESPRPVPTVGSLLAPRTTGS
jgi:hypothetical protein